METKIQDRHISEAIQLTTQERRFLTYVRTLEFMNLRLRGVEVVNYPHIDQKFIESEFFKYPANNRKASLQRLVDVGELQIFKVTNPNGNDYLIYHTLKGGPIDIEMYCMYKKHKEYGPNTTIMRDYLKRVSLPLPPHVAPNEYFSIFLSQKETCLDAFFTVDEFAGRVYTPVTSLERDKRPYLLIDYEPTISFDVKTMQPLLLGKILKDVLPHNEYSRWIDEGRDIYVMLQEKANLETRDQGKKRFFEIAFGPSSNELAEMFGGATWIKWINQYKKQVEPRNPHTKIKPHSNLAWLLQHNEVKTMQNVWRNLIALDVPFLSVHDEIIVKRQDRHIAESVFRSVLDITFPYYELNVK